MYNSAWEFYLSIKSKYDIELTEKDFYAKVNYKAGLVYMPYIVTQNTSIVSESVFPNKTILSRYATTNISNDSFMTFNDGEIIEKTNPNRIFISAVFICYYLTNNIDPIILVDGEESDYIVLIDHIDEIKKLCTINNYKITNIKDSSVDDRKYMLYDILVLLKYPTIKDSKSKVLLDSIN